MALSADSDGGPSGPTAGPGPAACQYKSVQKNCRPAFSRGTAAVGTFARHVPVGRGQQKPPGPRAMSGSPATTAGWTLPHEGVVGCVKAGPSTRRYRRSPPVQSQCVTESPPLLRGTGAAAATARPPPGWTISRPSPGTCGIVEPSRVETSNWGLRFDFPHPRGTPVRPPVCPKTLRLFLRTASV